MPSQKFKATVFVPRLTEIASIIEIDVNPQDTESDIAYKLLKKIDIYKKDHCFLLRKIAHSQASLSRLIEYRRYYKHGV